MIVPTTIVAIALGFAPVNNDGTVQPSRDNYAGIVGRYSQTIDAQGRTHLSGFNRLTGAPYDVVVDKDGNVSADIGAWQIEFRVKETG
jgi:hypothetical protein